MSSKAPKTNAPVIEPTQAPIEPALLIAGENEPQAILASGDSRYAGEVVDTPASAAQSDVAAPYLATDGPMEQATPLSVLDGEAVRWMIAEAAYYKAEERNFEPGHEMEDWMAAEREFMSQFVSQ